MQKYLHRIVLFLIVTLVINVGGWTFNREAVADIMFGAQETVVLQADANSAQFPSDKLPCNHWCQAIVHFVGMTSDWGVTVLPATPELFSVLYTLDISSQPNGLYRPPRLIS